MRNKTAYWKRGACCAALCVPLMVLGGPAAIGQEVSDSNPNQTKDISVSAADHAAANSAKSYGKQFLPGRHASGSAAGSALKHPHAKAVAAASQASANASYPSLPSPGYFATDVVYNGGEVVNNAINYPVYVNTTPSAVGNPGTLLRDLGKSEMVHTIDQYVGLYNDNRYKAGVGLSLPYPISSGTALQDSDIATIVHAAAAANGKSGYQTVYHIFLAPGQSVCSEGSCYPPAPDNSTGFCAYHDSYDFTDIGHVLYSLEPYQAVAGCQTGPPSPNGLVVDSTMNTLLHEYFETITDPDGDAWFNTLSLDEDGSEIADICVTTSPLYPIVRLNGTKYEVQGLYSNVYHGCAYVP